jgi:uncharacterized protein (TIGR03437 family)
VDVDGQNNLYFINGGYLIDRIDTTTIYRVSQTGTVSTVFALAPQIPSTYAAQAFGITAAADAAYVAVASIFGSSVVRLDSKGQTKAGPAPTFNFPLLQSGGGGIRIARNGLIYVADPLNNQISLLSSSANGAGFVAAGTGVSGYSGDGGAATKAQFNSPNAVATYASSGIVFVADTGNHCVRKFSVTGGVVSTVAGVCTQAGFSGDTGQATAAKLSGPTGLAVSPDGRTLYISDTGNNRIRRVNLDGTIETIAGIGQATFANGVPSCFDDPFSSACFFGDGGDARKAILNGPRGIALDSQGRLYIADTKNNRIRMLSFVPTGTPSCIYAIVPASQFAFGGGGGTGTVTVTAGSGCAWTATSNSSFLTITSGSSGSGNGTVGFSVAANSSTASRTGTLTIAGQTLTVTQAGMACSYAISPANQFFGANGLPGTLSVTTGSGCTWTATSNDAWITITSGASGSGNGSVGYSMAANSDASPRTGTLTIAGQTFTVTQAGRPAGCSIFPAYGLDFVGVAFTGTVAVTAGSGGCTWTATSNDPWITITSGFSGTGDGTVGYSVAAYVGVGGGDNSRTGTLNIAGQTFVFLQSAPFTSCKTPEPSFYAVSPESQPFAASGGTGIVAVTAGPDCYWLATSNSSFLTITSGFGGFGNGATGYSVAANSGTASRTGTLSIAGKAFTVTQAGNPGSGGNKPVIRAANGVVNGASFLPGIVPGSFATIFGTNLASTTTGKDWSGSITNGQLPTQIDGVSVSIAGKPAYIEYIRQDQINLQVPDVGVGPVQVTVTNSDGASDPATVTSQEFGPAFFLFGTKYAVAQHYPDYGYSSNPSWVPGAVAAKPGDILILWGTGFGPTNPAVPAGQVPPPTGPSVTGGGVPVTVTVGGVSAQLISAVLSPYTAVYQIAIQLPSTLPNGDIPVKASIGSYQSPDNVYIYVQN